MAHELPHLPKLPKLAVSSILDFTKANGIFLEDPPPHANRMVDLSIIEGYIKIDPRDTRDFCAAVSYYNDIYKIITKVCQSRDGPELNTQRGDVSSKMQSLEALYKSPDSDKDLRIGLMWFKVLYLLGDHVAAYSVIRLVHSKTPKSSPWLFKLVNRSKRLRESQDKSLAKLSGAPPIRDYVAKKNSRTYSLGEMRECILPDTLSNDVDMIIRLTSIPAKCDHARLLRHIVASSHNLEGRLTQLLEDSEILKEIIAHGINHTAMKKYKVADAAHVITVLKNSYNVLIGFMDAYDNSRMNINPMGPELLLRLQEKFLEPIRCNVIQVAQPRGEAMLRLGTAQTGSFRIYPNNIPARDGGSPRYCPPNEIRTAISWFFELLEKHISSEGEDPFMMAAWAHHFFELISPFQAYNLFMARMVVSYVLRRCEMLPLLVRSEDMLYYRQARACAYRTSDLSPLANFFSAMQIQALMVTIALDTERKKPSSRHNHFVLDLVVEVEELLKRILPKTRVEIDSYTQDDWSHGVPFEICPDNSYQALLYADTDSTVEPAYARFLICPFRPWRRGNVAVYLQDIAGYTLWLTCVNLIDPGTLKGEIERINYGCGEFLKGIERHKTKPGELPKVDACTCSPRSSYA